MIKILIFTIFSIALAATATLNLKENLQIIGGRNASEGEVPYQVALEPANNDTLFCGGVIISDEWILTAAHCTLTNTNPKSIKVRAGTIALDKGGTTYGVKAVYIHKDYDYFKYNNDISLIQLASKIKFNKLIQKIPMIEKDVDVKAGSIATVSGWGSYDAWKSDLAETLKITKISVVDHKKCAEKYQDIKRNITIDEVCAGWEEGNGVCHGDSGGPLVIDGKLVGLVSFGHGLCASGEYPQVYTSVAHHRDFIYNTSGL